MSRKERLVKLKEQLSERRKELLDILNGKAKDRSQRSRTGDVGDLALYNTSSEMSSRMSSIASDEIRQIEVALAKFKKSLYGICEVSGKIIPIARLQALPFTRFSVEAQRQQEELGLSDSDFIENWETAVAQENRLSDKSVNWRDVANEG